jgi:hypothetical protein
MPDPDFGPKNQPPLHVMSPPCALCCTALEHANELLVDKSGHPGAVIVCSTDEAGHAYRLLAEIGRIGFIVVPVPGLPWTFWALANRDAVVVSFP